MDVVRIEGYEGQEEEEERRRRANDNKSRNIVCEAGCVKVSKRPDEN